MRLKALLLAIAAMTVIIGFSPAAGADPKGPTINLENCTGGVPDGEIVVNNGNGPLTPGFATGSTGVYVPYAIDITFTVFNSQGNVLEESTESNAKANVPQNKFPQGDCTFDETIPVDPDNGIFARFTGTVSVFYTG